MSSLKKKKMLILQRRKVGSADELGLKLNVQVDLITEKDSSVRASEERISALETDKRNLEVEFDSLKQQKEALDQKISVTLN